MQIQYSLDRLEGLEEADLSAASFVTLTACPVCDGSRISDLASLRDSVTTAWCDDCGHSFQRRRPSDDWYAQWYRSGWDSAGAQTRLSSPWRSARKSAGLKLAGVAKRIVDRQGRKLMRGLAYDFCRPIVQRKFTVLDIGCGYGEALKPFAQRGCRVFGIEASSHRATAAREYGVETSNTPVERLAPDTFGTTFDLVISSHVIEHVVHPREFMEGARRVLRPGGWFCLAAPNVEHDFLLHNFFFALHVHHFSRASMKTLLARGDFSVERCQEDHELRMLAQYRPADKGFSRLASVRPIEINPRAIAEGVLGRGFDEGDERNGQRQCRWQLNTAAIDRRFDVRYDEPRVHTANDAANDDASANCVRAMTLAWRGPLSLPIKFSSAAGPAPFWVK